MFRSFAEQAEQLHEIEEGLVDGRIVLRTLLRTGARYKHEVADVTRSEETLRALRHARLPHWVWVVEAHRVDLCEQGEPCVVAAAVLDSTAFDEKPPLDILAMLSIVIVYPPDDTDEVSVPGQPDALGIAAQGALTQKAWSLRRMLTCRF